MDAQKNRARVVTWSPITASHTKRKRKLTVKKPEELANIPATALSKAGRDELAQEGQHGRSAVLIKWRAVMAVRQEKQQRQWGDLRNAVQAVVGSVAMGEEADATEAGRRAVGLEIELFGNSECTSELLLALGVEI